MREVTRLNREIKKLQRERTRLYKAYDAKYQTYFGQTLSNYEHPALFMEVARDQQRMSDVSNALADRYDRLHTLYMTEEYRRPDEWLFGLISRPLGPLSNPPSIVEPSRANIARVPRQRLRAFGLVAAAVGLLFAVSFLVPWLRTSPYMVLYAGLSAAFGPWGGAAAGFLIIPLTLLLSKGSVGFPSEGKFLDRAAMSEEQWFRRGSENWTVGQRLYSCAAFGVVHVANVVYPLSSLIVLSLVGGAFMHAYRSAYRRTGNSELAVLTSTRLHATYNRFAVLYFLAAVSISLFHVWSRL